MQTVNKSYHKYVILILIITFISIIIKAAISMLYSHSLSYDLVAPSVVGFLNSIFAKVSFFNANQTPRHGTHVQTDHHTILTKIANN